MTDPTVTGTITTDVISAVDAEHGWLIERGDSEGSRPLYWAGPGNWWTHDSLQAVRFARNVDAFRVAKQLTPPSNGVPHRVAEHVWSSK